MVEILVDGYTFLVTGVRFGLPETGGLFHRDTRHLSSLNLDFEDTPVRVVGSHESLPWRRTIKYTDLASEVNQIEGSEEQKHTSVLVTREQQIVEDAGLFEEITLRNDSPTPLRDTLVLSFDADFSDVFEVRNIGTELNRTVTVDAHDDHVEYRYADSVDGTEFSRSTSIQFGTTPASLSGERARFAVDLGPRETHTLRLRVAPGTPAEGVAAAFDEFVGHGRPDPTLFPADRTGSDRTKRRRYVGDDGSYEALFAQAGLDLDALLSETAHGPVPLAGVPWFATVFGRDSLITAYQTVHVAPQIAVATLRYLAEHQGTDHDEFREEEPGKILHEMRNGELAVRGEIPHTPYYGTIDATPLWLILLEETDQWTTDTDVVDDLWDHVERAGTWLTDAIDRIGDDPFLYYRGTEGVGQSHKAWRDTERSVQFSDGRAAEVPIASVEVQGYAYDALRRTATLARNRGRDDLAATYDERARSLKTTFNRAFWMPDQEYYAAAMTPSDGVVDSRTSNVGQCLWSGVVDRGRADAVIETLLDEGLNSGWGIRTMSRDDAGYSPVSYHVGSVWPHDNSLIALGAARYGFHGAAETIATNVLDACVQLDGGRVPELYCGFDDSMPPQPYPSACEPQAWGAGAPFAMLRALFDLHPGESGDVRVGNIPESVPTTPIRRLMKRQGSQRTAVPSMPRE